MSHALRNVRRYLVLIFHRALIEKDGETNAIEIQLLDNGSGADAVANDGLYSRYFAGFDN